MITTVTTAVDVVCEGLRGRSYQESYREGLHCSRGNSLIIGKCQTKENKTVYKKRKRCFLLGLMSRKVSGLDIPGADVSWFYTLRAA